MIPGADNGPNRLSSHQVSKVEIDNSSLSKHRGGKRLANIHGEPKSSTYKAQLEYLDKIASKYQELIDTEEQMKVKAELIDNHQYQVKESAKYEKASKTR